MPKLYDNLLAPEWRVAIAPQDLGDNVLRSLRTITGRMAALTTLDMSSETVRPFYSIIEVPLKEIEYVNALASEEVPITAGNAIAGVLNVEQFLSIPERVGRYRFKSDAKDIDVFGAGIVDNIAIVGRDFLYADGYYWFLEHPSKFGTIGVSGNKETLALPCIGGPLSTSQDPLGEAYRQCADFTTHNAIQAAVYGGAPNGITNELLYAVGGMKLSESPLFRVWEEGDYYLGITIDGDFVYAPINAGVRFTEGYKPDASAPENTS